MSKTRMRFRANQLSVRETWLLPISRLRVVVLEIRQVDRYDFFAVETLLLVRNNEPVSD